MNNNHPLFKKVQKIARMFNTKPMFLDFDIKNDKPILVTYKKYKHDCLDLIFVKGVPIKIAYKIYGFNGASNKHTKIDNLFYNKKFDIYTLVDIEGLIQFTLKIENDVVFVKRHHPLYEETPPTTYALNLKNIYQIAEQIKNENKEMFYF